MFVNLKLTDRKKVRMVGQSADVISHCRQFREWVRKFDHRRMCLQLINVQSADIFEGGKVLFAKIEVLAHLRSDRKKRPLAGIMFLRGDAITILVLVRCKETGEMFILVTRQPRLPLGISDFAEIVAGTMDKSDGLAGRAIAEIEEEAGIAIKKSALRPLGQWVPSAGGCDERVASFWTLVELTRRQVNRLLSKIRSAKGENEQIRIEIYTIMEFVARLRDGRFCDGKMLASLMLLLLEQAPDLVTHALTIAGMEGFKSAQKIQRKRGWKWNH